LLNLVKITMLHEFTTFLGVDISGGRKPFTYVALDGKRKALAMGGGSAVDVLSFAAGQASVLLAISASGPTSNLVAPAKGGEPPLPVLRLASPRQFNLDGQPSADYPAWSRAAFAMVEQFSSLDFKPFPAEEHPRQWLEAPAESGFQALLGLPPLDGGTLEGRIQRQLVLFDQDLDVPDAMEFFEEITRFKILHSHLPYDKVLPSGELNAWLAASTAWQAAKLPASVRQSGAVESGLVYYPLKLEKDQARA
jgi:hypothetical protein